ncbi:phosphatase 1 regulatory subunit 12A-like [Paramuricea clavata]|uniref:Phosphatase 1 regulatory subunit 12A-like n=1 Tax=Paramuricea clavata TaxID=317549 RepID=A0A7D9ER79_PARCT|nr:phosphatase 1 regulatory subunit 12A-like [Paramuricea clavata]
MMIQGILRTHASSEPRTHIAAEKLQSQGGEKRQVANTTLRVKMKVVKKTKNLRKTNGEIQTDKMGRDVMSTSQSRAQKATDKQAALLQVPSDERLRRRLSDSLEFGKPAPRVRRRSVSFDPLTVFKTAILENDVDAAKSVLVSGKVNANSTVDGVLPVILASKEGCAECLELLIEKGGSIDVCDKRGFTPLELAVQGGHFDCAQVLIAAGANANSIRDGYFDESIEHGRHTTGRSRSRTF